MNENKNKMFSIPQNTNNDTNTLQQYLIEQLQQIDIAIENLEKQLGNKEELERKCLQQQAEIKELQKLNGN